MLITFARNRKLTVTAMAVPGTQGEIRRSGRMVHNAYVQKSTVFAIVTRGQSKKPVLSAVRRGVCDV